jgi:hypothetical protein
MLYIFLIPHMRIEFLVYLHWLSEKSAKTKNQYIELISKFTNPHMSHVFVSFRKRSFWFDRTTRRGHNVASLLRYQRSVTASVNSSKTHLHEKHAHATKADRIFMSLVLKQNWFSLLFFNLVSSFITSRPALNGSIM